MTSRYRSLVCETTTEATKAFVANINTIPLLDQAHLIRTT